MSTTCKDSCSYRARRLQSNTENIATRIVLPDLYARAELVRNRMDSSYGSQRAGYNLGHMRNVGSKGIFNHRYIKIEKIERF